jgi:hypothetical protein
MLFLLWELRDSNRAADRGSGRPSPILCLLADAARAEATFDLKQKKHRLLDAFSSVGVEGFERQRPTVPDPLLGTADAQFGFQNKKSTDCSMLFLLWELRDSNPRPSACKADALNQLS